MKGKYCLDSVVPFSGINQSHTNRSSTKQTFSFSKSPRFDSSRGTCPVSTYDGKPVQRKNSGTAMGFGNKSDFTKTLTVSPRSTKYEIKSLFDNNKNFRKGYSLRKSRENIVFDSYIGQEQLKNPGIGRYQVERQLATIATQAPRYSLRPRTRVSDLTKTIEAQNKNPGPDSYENNPEMAATSYSSHFKRIKYSQTRSRRFLTSDNKVPGPADYENPTNMSKVGKYVMSNHKGGTGAKFDSDKRKTRFDDAEAVSKKLPGPGHYRATSEFGQYDGDVYSNQMLYVGSSRGLK